MKQFAFAGEVYPLERVIGHLGTSGPDRPVAIFFAGMHGNEPTGVIALQQVLRDLSARQVTLHGEVLALAGNLNALENNRRFIWRDLNRIWPSDFELFFSQPPDSSERNGSVELRERRELFSQIYPYLSQPAPLYFFDLHTTSAESAPFIVINDQLSNRKLARQFPLPIVLGLEEFLAGPLLSYLNDRGYTAIGFEAGEHQNQNSVDAHRAFIYLALVNIGILTTQDVPDYSAQVQLLKTWHNQVSPRLAGSSRFLEVLYRCEIKPGQTFRMANRMANFEAVAKNQPLAYLNDKLLKAPLSGYIFMPLYQQFGEDGFFLVRSIPQWALKLSIILRRFNFDTWLCWLPGVRRDRHHPETLVVNPKIARFLAMKIFHLLGYRRKTMIDGLLYFSRREIW